MNGDKSFHSYNTSVKHQQDGAAEPLDDAPDGQWCRRFDQRPKAYDNGADAGMSVHIFTLTNRIRLILSVNGCNDG